MRTEGHLVFGGGTHARFPTKTHWTHVVAAGGSSSPGAQAALNHLCQTYWFPIYAFIRRKGHDSHAAKDLTQAFFAHLAETDLIRSADRQTGRFRSYVCKACENFLADQRRRANALKRGGAAHTFSLDETEAEDKYRHLPSHEPVPTSMLDRTWAATVIEQATKRLKQAYADRGRLAVYEALKRCLNGELTPGSYPELAARLGLTKATLEVNLSRFRKAFGKCVRGVVGETVDAAEIDGEIRYLMAAWSAYLNEKPGATSRLA
jgi:RNA polymerase sigma factor (sigma-70 family)